MTFTAVLALEFFEVVEIQLLLSTVLSLEPFPEQKFEIFSFKFLGEWDKLDGLSHSPKNFFNFFENGAPLTRSVKDKNGNFVDFIVYIFYFCDTLAPKSCIFFKRKIFLRELQ